LKAGRTTQLLLIVVLPTFLSHAQGTFRNLDFESAKIPVLLAGEMHAQGTFRNLDLESANVRDLAPRSFEVIPTAQGIPGWTQYSAGHEAPDAAHNALSLGSPVASILGPPYALDSVHLSPIIEGKYLVYMRPGPSLGQDLVS
jgi:hypothetical protein